MFKPVRIVATLVFLLMIGLIFVGAFVIKIDVSVLHNPRLYFSRSLYPAQSRHSVPVSGWVFFFQLAKLYPQLIILSSLCFPRVFGLYVVHPLLHPLRQNGGAQVFWNVTFISVSDLTLFPPNSMPPFPSFNFLFPSRSPRVCVGLFGRRQLDRCTISAS